MKSKNKNFAFFLLWGVALFLATCEMDWGDEQEFPPLVFPLEGRIILYWKVELTWVDNLNNEDGFRIERNLKGTTAWEEFGEVEANVFSFVKDARPPGVYNYRVYAYNTRGKLAYSNIIELETPVLCGDGFCNSPETSASCYRDCGFCGDGVCTSPPETLAECPRDCAVCGDSLCTSPPETLAGCPEDCAACGDGECTSPLETDASCYADCGKCGDGVCTRPPETLAGCTVDCADCGDGECTSPPETADSCLIDCAGEGGGAGRLMVLPDAGGGYLVRLRPPTTLPGSTVDYPGVSAFAALINISHATVSPEGTSVTLTVSSPAMVERLWFRIRFLAGADLVSQPTVERNLQGDDIFVLGPLAPGAPLPITLVFAPDDPPPASYVMEFDFLYIRPRVAFSSDRATRPRPGRGEVFTIDRLGGPIYQVTSNTYGRSLKPVWSPGGEWLAIEREQLYRCTDGRQRMGTQIYLHHPDGSEGGWGGQVSSGVFRASDPTFNPTGELVAYEARLECEPLEGDTTTDTSMDILLYDVRKRQQTTLFYGDPYTHHQIWGPEWSPDGEYMVMSAVGPAGARWWFYAPMDPLTGDTEGMPVKFMQNGFSKNNRRLWVHEWSWGPDARHAAVRCEYAELVGSTWITRLNGVGIINFQEVLNANPSEYPMVPTVVPVADNSGIYLPNYPSLNETGTEAWFDWFVTETNADLQYIRLNNNYQPLVRNQRVTFLDDQFFNRTPALFPSIRAEFFPLLP